MRQPICASLNPVCLDFRGSASQTLQLAWKMISPNEPHQDRNTCDTNNLRDIESECWMFGKIFSCATVWVLAHGQRYCHELTQTRKTQCSIRPKRYVRNTRNLKLVTHQCLNSCFLRTKGVWRNIRSLQEVGPPLAARL